jgi:LPS-assembly protein
MKNNIFLIIFFLIINNNSYAQSFNFKTKNLEIFNNESLIKASYGRASSVDGDLIINADRFIYEINKKVLKASGNGLITIKSRNLEIFFDELNFDENTSLLKLSNNLRFFETINKLEIYTDSLIFNQNQNYLKSDTKSKLIDKLNNNYIVDKFFYQIDNDIIKADNLFFVDKKNNKFNSSLAYLDINSGKLYSKDSELNLAGTNENSNEPRIKGKSLINDEEFTQINKGVFTTCRKRNGCPPWKITSEKIIHDKKKQIIKYEDAKFFIYDVPILYLPRFFYPDPTVKRQSGFLAPLLNNSINNSKNFISIPYFYAPTDNKDFTFTPRFYDSKNLLVQNEFRQAGNNSGHIADFSFFDKEKNGHLYYEYKKLSNFENFKNSDLNIKLQQTSDNNYIKKNDIYSEINNDLNFLENSINLNLYSDNYSLKFNSSIFEDLNKNKNDKYEYIIPQIDLFWDIENKTNLDGDLSLETNNLIRNYDTNVYEKSNINNLNFLSTSKISRSGIINDYQLQIKNTNTDSQNSSTFKDKENFNISGLLQLNSTFPLQKQSELYQNIFTPKISMKIAPEHTRNYKNDDNKIDVNNIYSFNRMNKNDAIEGGLSLAYGADYNLFNKKSNDEVLSFKIANNLRIKENPDIAHSQQLNQKTSNIFMQTQLKPNRFLDLKYESAIKNNLSEISNENILANLKFKNFKISFDYLNENSNQEKNSYLTNKTSYIFNDKNSIEFETRENKKTNSNEFYKLVYQFKNDCLTASIEYNKDYYNNSDIKNSENIMFKFSIISFGQTGNKSTNY